MKKVLSLILILIMCFSLCACSPDPEVVKEKLQGYWFYYTESGTTASYTMYLFKDDMFSWVNSINGITLSNEAGTYTIQGNQIKLNYSNPSSGGRSSIPFKLDGDELIFNVDSSGNSLYVHYDS